MDEVLHKIRSLLRGKGGTACRFGRIHKIDKTFNGMVRDVVWNGPCKRRGGGFELICDYKDLKGESHKVVLRRMFEDYTKHVAYLVAKKVKPLKKRRKAYTMSVNTTINSAKDLQLCIGGEWKPLHQVFPSDVRELEPASCRLWLKAHNGGATLNHSAANFVDSADILNLPVRHGCGNLSISSIPTNYTVEEEVANLNPPLGWSPHFEDIVLQAAKMAQMANSSVKNSDNGWWNENDAFTV